MVKLNSSETLLYASLLRWREISKRPYTWATIAKGWGNSTLAPNSTSPYPFVRCHGAQEAFENIMFGLIAKLKSEYGCSPIDMDSDNKYFRMCDWFNPSPDEIEFTPYYALT